MGASFDKKSAAAEIAIAGAAGGATGGPAGTAVGIGAGALSQGVLWVRDRSFGDAALAELQKDRLGETIEEASRTIEAMRMLGHEVREDWFIEDQAEGKLFISHPGLEILEGTLIAAANEFERRKTRLIANLWSQLAFNPSVPDEEGIYLLKVASELSYRQFAVLAVLTELSGPPPTAERAELDLAVASGPVVQPNTGHDSDHPFTGSGTTAALLFDLIRRDLARQDDGRQIPSDVGRLRPWRCRPTLLGLRLYVLTAMRTHVPIEVKEELARELVEHD